MYTVKNRQNAPLVSNIPDEAAIYWMPKEIKTLTAHQYNAKEIQAGIRYGVLVVLRME